MQLRLHNADLYNRRLRHCKAFTEYALMEDACLSLSRPARLDDLAMTDEQKAVVVPRAVLRHVQHLLPNLKLQRAIRPPDESAANSSTKFEARCHALH